MVDTTSAIKVLYELEKQHRNYHHADVVRSVMAEMDSLSFEFLRHLAVAVFYDLDRLGVLNDEQRNKACARSVLRDAD